MSLLVEQPPAPSPAGDAEPEPPRLRVLVSAYALSPAQGSEPGLGWNVCSRLARRHDVTVLCAPGLQGEDPDQFRREVEAHRRANGAVPGLTVRFVEPPLLSEWLQRETGLRRRTVYYAGYAAWQRAAYRVAEELHARRPFDVVHHLNITGYREPGYLWKLDAPFVWGPVGGAADVPWPFLRDMGWGDRFFYAARNVANALQQRLARRCRRAARAARHVWAIGEENRRMIRRWGRDAEAVIESGSSPAPGPRKTAAAIGRRPLRVVWSGEHIGRKDLPILLHALAALAPTTRANLECVVLGSGAQTQNWKGLAQRLGVAPHIRWTGQLLRDAAIDEVRRADVMAFTSVQEGTPQAVTEALSLGVPVVCHDACGMGLAVTDRCGIKVPLRDPRTSAEGFAAALTGLAADPLELHRLSEGALERAHELHWDHVARRIADVYLAVAAAPHGRRQ
jgi:glycosyltransferase involved in cell wall biosynthesis